jgi:hypothetical protein
MSLPALRTPRAATDDLRTRPLPSRQPSRPPRRLAAVALALALIASSFAARSWMVARHDAITSDESTHLVHILHYGMTGDDLAMWELGAPRLPHLLGGLATYRALSAAAMLPASADPEQIQKVVTSGAARVILPARALAIGWGLVLIVAVFGAVARTRGAGPGLLAAAIVAMVPEVLAHSAIAGSDLPFTAAAFVALIVNARYAERPGPGRWLALALAIGLAWAIRHSALLLLILAAGTHLVLAIRRPRPGGFIPLVESVLGSFAASMALAVVAFAVLWAGDGFGTVSVAEVSERAATLQVPRRLGPIDLSGVPLPTSALSVLKQVRHQNQGHEAYLCGEVRPRGWWSYFPIAFGLKTPVGLLLLMIVAAARIRPKGSWEVLCVAALGLLWLTLVRSRVNIGVRYALLTYPLAAPFVSRLFEPRMLRDRIWGPLTIAATLWFVGASVSCHPRYLSYFNELGGGPKAGWLYLADSNVDWGQDLDELGRALVRLGIKEVTTDVTSERRLGPPGVAVVVNPSRAMQVPAAAPLNRRLYDSEGGYIPVYTRYVAVSVSRLLGLYSQNDMSWLRTRRLVDRVGDSIFIFDMDRPADRDLLD